MTTTQEHKKTKTLLVASAAIAVISLGIAIYGLQIQVANLPIQGVIFFVGGMAGLVVAMHTTYANASRNKAVLTVGAIGGAIAIGVGYGIYFIFHVPADGLLGVLGFVTFGFAAYIHHEKIKIA